MKKRDNIKDLDLVFCGPLEMTNPQWIHPENYSSSKPMNVLWTSPINPKTGLTEWEEWCERNDFNGTNGDEKWHIVPNGDCKTLVLDRDFNTKHEKYLLKDSHGEYSDFDFEAVARDYDALYVPKEVLKDLIFNSWDVPTACFLKPKYTVMNDEEYELYKQGKLTVPQKSPEVVYEPDVNIDIPDLTPLKKIKPTDHSFKKALKEIKNLKDEKLRDYWLKNIEEYHEKLDEELKNIKGGLALSKWIYKKQHRYPSVWTNSSPEVMEIFLRHGMSPDNIQAMPHLSLWNEKDIENEKTNLELVLRYGAKAEKFVTAGYFGDFTRRFLYDSIEYKLDFSPDPKSLHLFLRAGMDPDVRNKYGETMTMRTDNPKAMALLFAAGADYNAVDEQGKTVEEHISKIPYYNLRLQCQKVLEQYKQYEKGNKKAVEIPFGKIRKQYKKQRRMDFADKILSSKIFRVAAVSLAFLAGGKGTAALWNTVKENMDNDAINKEWKLQYAEADSVYADAKTTTFYSCKNFTPEEKRTLTEQVDKLEKEYLQKVADNKQFKKKIGKRKVVVLEERYGRKWYKLSDGDYVVDDRMAIVNNKIAELRKKISTGKAYEVAVDSDGMRKADNTFNIIAEKNELDQSLNYAENTSFGSCMVVRFNTGVTLGRSGKSIKEELLQASKERKESNSL